MIKFRRAGAAVTILVAATAIAFSRAQALDIAHLMGFGDDDPTLETFKIIHIADLKTLMADRRAPVHIFDANVAETRTRFGVIPGAALLDSDNHYDLAVLPPAKDAKLVFYCANSL